VRDPVKAQYLSYGVAGGSSRRRWAVMAVAGFLLTVLCCWGAPSGRKLISQWQNRRLVRECELYALAPDVIAYEPDPQRAASLCSTGKYRHVASDTADAIRIVLPWGTLSKQIGLAAEDAAVFCHARQSPMGHNRLVIINSIRDGIATGFVIDSSLSAPKVLRASGWGYPSWGASYRILQGECGDPVLNAGQSDDKDRSHFAIGYSVGGETGTIDGWLLDDDRVRLRALTGPCRRPLKYFEAAERSVERRAMPESVK
jgi:hypothetical protein